VLFRGFAALMRGKSVTCRNTLHLWQVYDLLWKRSETFRIGSQLAGKSKTCRASGWHSHGGALDELIQSFL
jgi:hypothetical protein